MAKNTQNNTNAVILYNEENMNIHAYPAEITTHPSDVRITLGDMHANPIKGLHCLIKEGIIELGKYQFDKIVELYDELHMINLLTEDNNEQTAKNAKVHAIRIISRIKEIFEDIKKVPNAPLFTFIGDVFADRGLNDGITADLFKQLVSVGVEFENISSNHDLWFIEYCQTLTSKLFNNQNNQANSLAEFKTNRNDIDYNDAQLKDFFENVYLPRLKLISYDLNNEGIVIYTHAGILFEQIEKIAIFLKTPFDASTPELLAASIDAINKTYVEQLRTGMIQAHDFAYGDPHPLEPIHWYRHSGAPQPAPTLGYNIQFIHGHDAVSTYAKGCGITLDGHLGKLPGRAQFREGTYAVTAVKRDCLKAQATNDDNDVAPELIPITPRAATQNPANTDTHNESFFTEQKETPTKSATDTNISKHKKNNKNTPENKTKIKTSRGIKGIHLLAGLAGALIALACQASALVITASAMIGFIGMLVITSIYNMFTAKASSSPKVGSPTPNAESCSDKTNKGFTPQFGLKRKASDTDLSASVDLQHEAQHAHRLVR